jgi:glucose-1-phosphate cytidylyltransferase
MKTVILAGGQGSRISEETYEKPKPMITIGGKPIIWHIMKIYSYYGFKEFIICLGYRGKVIEEYFLKKPHDWSIKLVHTGKHTLTGGRLKRIKKYVKNEKHFFMTYGDGLANINLKKLLNFHNNHKKLATMTVVNPPSRFGSVKMKKDKVINFQEKPVESPSINGGFFVLSPKTLDFIGSDETSWEKKTLKKIVKKNQLMGFTHKSFFQPMDTLRDKKLLENMWKKDRPPWKVWK